MKRIILIFILLLTTFVVYSGILAMISVSSTVMNILAVVAGFIWTIILYKSLNKLYDYDENA